MNADFALTRLAQAVERAHPELTLDQQAALLQKLHELNAYQVDGDGNLVPGDSATALDTARRVAPKVASQIAKTHADRCHPPGTNGAANTVEHLRALGISPASVFEDEDDGDFPLGAA